MNNFWKKLPKPILALAPMAGITDSAFRQICRENGADIVYSEMASATALFFSPKKTLELVRFSKQERPYVVQLFGKMPEHFAKATKIISREIKPDGIDINFGCPAKKVFSHGSGCALMPQKELARKIISVVCENTNLPVSIKIRAGLKKKTHSGKRPGMFSQTNALEFIQNTRDLPYSAVMIHGRTYEDGFSGPVNFKLIEEIKKIIPKKIVLGNGGIDTPEEAADILKKYPTFDGLGIARGAWGRPFIFDEIKKIIAKKHSKISLLNIKSFKDIVCNANDTNQENEYDLQKIKNIMLRHAELIFADKGERGLLEIRKHMAWYVKGFPGASEIRRKLVTAESLDEIKKILISKLLSKKST